MNLFSLTVSTPDGMEFQGQVERIKCRSITGDLAILAGHCNYCTALGMGAAYVQLEDGTRRTAACIGGMLSVMNGACHLLATTWEFKEDIDVERAKRAKAIAEERLAKPDISDNDKKLAEAKLKRALIRIGVAEEG
jgi:F-type H+-transporting ATPase subunit epsilon